MLIQVYRSTIRALDFATGALRSQATHPEGKSWSHPAVEEDILVVAESSRPHLENVHKISGYTKSWSTEVVALAGISMKDGKQLWRTPLPNPGFLLDNCIRDGRSFMTLVQIKTEKPGKGPDPDVNGIPGLCVRVRDGAIQWQQTMAWRGGHPPHTMATADAVWLTSHVGGIGVPVGGGDSIDPISLRGDRNIPWYGCSTTWMSERYMFSRLSVTELATGRFRYNSAVRAACVFGTVPAHGLLYNTPHSCGCHSYITGHNAAHSRDLVAQRTPWAGTRLFTGPGKPSPAPGEPATDEWPIFLRDSARSNWNDATLAKDIALAWSLPAPTTKAPGWLVEHWDTAIQQHPGRVTALTAAEGIVAGAYTNLHTLFVADAATGTIRWTKQLDSMIDSPPTIHRGVLYVGTRGGWLWALSRDTGEVVWRFLASPHQRLMVVNGALESTTPLYGTVAVHEGRLWISAGRSAELDNGITWYSLDPASGAVRSTGRIHNDEPWFKKGEKFDIQAHIKGINSPLIIKGDFALLAPMAFKPSDGSLLVAGTDFGATLGRGAALNPVPVPGRAGLVYRGEDSGRHGNLMFYGGTSARWYAHRGTDYVVAEGGVPGARGGGGKEGVGRWKRIEPREEGRNVIMSEPVWEHPSLYPGRGTTATGLAVAGDTVIAVMPEKKSNPVGSTLMVRYRYADGARIGETVLPQQLVMGGLSVAKDAIFLAHTDGSVSAYR